MNEEESENEIQQSKDSSDEAFEYEEGAANNRGYDSMLIN